MEKQFVTDRRGRRKGWLNKFAALALLLGLAVSCGRASDDPATGASNITADRILRAMSGKLAQSQRLTFKVTRQLDAALIDGRDIPESAQIEVAVSRPDRLSARSTSDEGVRKFYADGKNVSLFDEGMNLYATVPFAGTIDEMVARLDEAYGFTPPLAEFALNDPYAKISRQIQDSSYKGVETVNGVSCQRVTVTGELADADIWIAELDHLPRRLVATFKDREGSPQLKADFSEWNLKAKHDAKTFSFDPPKDAEKIEMLTAERITEAGQKSQEKEK